jgi:hypothetical protein
MQNRQVSVFWKKGLPQNKTERRASMDPDPALFFENKCYKKYQILSNFHREKYYKRKNCWRSTCGKNVLLKKMSI